MKKRELIGGDIFWKEDQDGEEIRDREICKVLRKIGVLSISPIGNNILKGVRWRINVNKIKAILGENDGFGTDLSH